MATNLIGLLILVALFVLLRKNAWRVVNKIVKKDEVDRWTHIFFSFTSNLGDQVSPGPGLEHRTFLFVRELAEGSSWLT